MKLIKKFSLPGYFTHFNDIMAILNYRNDHPDYFELDRIIDSAYGFPSGLPWNGGRINPIRDYSPQELNDRMYQLFSIPNLQLRHTCTNKLITESLAYDWYCNFFLEVWGREGDGIIVNNPILIDYLQKNYPQFQYIYSTTLGLTEIEDINAKTETNLLVLNYNYNNNNEYLQKLTHPNNIEILCAEPCIMHCPHRDQHYTSLSKLQLWLTLDEEEDIDVCPFNCEGSPFYRIQQLPTAISNERINELSDMGFQYFKISGRSISSEQWRETVLYYLIKPEYYEMAREDIRNY